MKIYRTQASELSPDILDNFASDSFFGSTGFMNLWREVKGTPVYWVAEDKGSVKALLPGVEFGLKPVRRFQSMPDGCYSRLLVSDADPAIQAHVASAMMRAISEAGYARAFVYDLHSLFAPDADFSQEECRTLLIDISGEAWLPPDKKLQSEIRKAQREEIEFCRFDPDKHFDSFLDLMKQTEQRHDRKPKYPDNFFKALAELARTDDRIIWYWCEHEGRAATTHINIIEDDMVLNWQVYYDKTFSFLKINQLLLITLASEARERGVNTINLGSSPVEAEGLEKYKQKWGGTIHRYQCHVFKSALGKML